MKKNNFKLRIQSVAFLRSSNFTVIGQIKKEKKEKKILGIQDDDHEEDPTINGDGGGRERRVLLLPLRPLAGDGEEFDFFPSLANASFSPSHGFSSIL